MATLKTNYVDDVINGSARKYNIVNNEDGTIGLADATSYKTVGTEFGASDINATNTQVNTNTTAIGGNKLEFTDGNFYISNGTTRKKLGSSEGTATTSDVLSGATFNSKTTPDSENYSIGSMPDQQGKTVVATTVTSDKVNAAITIPSRGCYDTSSKISIPQAKLVNVYDLGTGTSWNIKTLFPSVYASLNADNFKCEPVSMSASGSGGIKNRSGSTNNLSRGSGQSITTGTDASGNFSKSYSNGVLTCSMSCSRNSENQDQHGDFWNGVASVSASVGSFHAYLVLGGIANA